MQNLRNTKPREGEQVSKSRISFQELSFFSNIIISKQVIKLINIEPIKLTYLLHQC